MFGTTDVCLTCGDIGEARLLICCIRCNESVVHHYCMEKFSPSDDDICWTCWDCEEKTCTIEPSKIIESTSPWRNEAAESNSFLTTNSEDGKMNMVWEKEFAQKMEISSDQKEEKKIDFSTMEVSSDQEEDKNTDCSKMEISYHQKENKKIDCSKMEISSHQVEKKKIDCSKMGVSSHQVKEKKIDCPNMEISSHQVKVKKIDYPKMEISSHQEEKKKIDCSKMDLSSQDQVKAQSNSLPTERSKHGKHKKVQEIDCSSKRDVSSPQIEENKKAMNQGMESKLETMSNVKSTKISKHEKVKNTQEIDSSSKMKVSSKQFEEKKEDMNQGIKPKLGIRSNENSKTVEVSESLPRKKELNMLKPFRRSEQNIHKDGDRSFLKKRVNFMEPSDEKQRNKGMVKRSRVEHDDDRFQERIPTYVEDQRNSSKKFHSVGNNRNHRSRKPKRSLLLDDSRFDKEGISVNFEKRSTSKRKTTNIVVAKSKSLPFEFRGEISPFKQRKLEDREHARAKCLSHVSSMEIEREINNHLYDEDPRNKEAKKMAISSMVDSNKIFVEDSRNEVEVRALSSQRLLSTNLAKPVIYPIWRGYLSILDRENRMNIGILGHISNKACVKVFNTTPKLSPVLLIDIEAKCNVWPNSFRTSPPTSDSIALFFFKENERDEKAYNDLLEDVIEHDLALRAFVTDDIELLIFSSLDLPPESRRFNNKYYLWGVFRHKFSSHEISASADLIGYTYGQHSRESEEYRISRMKSYNVICEHRSRYTTSIQVSEDLTPKYGDSLTSKFHHLACKFNSYQKRPEHTMKQHLMAMSKMLQELRDVGSIITDEEKIQGLVRSLPVSWVQEISTLFNCGKIKTFEDVVSYLELAEESSVAANPSRVESKYDSCKAFQPELKKRDVSHRRNDDSKYRVEEGRRCSRRLDGRRDRRSRIGPFDRSLNYNNGHKRNNSQRFGRK